MTTADSALRSSGFAVGRLLLPALDSDKIEAAGLGVAGVMADDGSRHREDQSGAVAKEGLRTTVNARAGSGLPAPNGIAAKGRDGIRSRGAAAFCVLCFQITAGTYITVNNATD